MGTITEIYDYLRLLYASVGTPHCPKCGRPIARQTARNRLWHRIGGVGPRGERHRDGAGSARLQGRVKIFSIRLTSRAFAPRVDGEMRDLSEPLLLDRRKNHTIEAVIDRILLKPVAAETANASQAKPSMEKRLETENSGKAMQISVWAGGGCRSAGGEEQLFSSSWPAPGLRPRTTRGLDRAAFSFNIQLRRVPELSWPGLALRS